MSLFSKLNPKKKILSRLAGGSPPSEKDIKDAIIQEMGEGYADKFFKIVEESKKLDAEELREIFKQLAEVTKEAIMTIEDRNHVDYYVGIMNGMILKAQSGQGEFNKGLWCRLAKIWGIEE